ncbi:MAG: hypothetical protein WC755_07080 [Candidatus Woesearchaeota archaeon]|jgi:hypothetical protein
MGRKKKEITKQIEETKATEKVHERKNKSLIVTFRVLQSLCFGVFALGLSFMAGDYTAFIKTPFSTMAITTTIFGLMGSVITGIMAKQCENW